MTFKNQLRQIATEEAARLGTIAAVDRARTYFPVSEGGHYTCPFCWMHEGLMAPLKAVGPGPDDAPGADHFRCVNDADHEFSAPAL